MGGFDQVLVVVMKPFVSLSTGAGKRFYGNMALKVGR
jgi:hypothetical protein